jgi:hypothetical protein
MLGFGANLGVWLTHDPAAFIIGKEPRYLIWSSLGELEGRSGQVRNISPSTGFALRTVQPTASHVPTRYPGRNALAVAVIIIIITSLILAALHKMCPFQSSS